MGKDSKKVTIIIPVYNVESTLRRCVDSVINQTYRNVEVVLVDDGSKDNSPAICDEYSLRDSRVTVLHKKNGGLSSARNAALDSPLTGDFLTFVDSDDWLELSAIEECVAIVESNKLDALLYDCLMTGSEKVSSAKKLHEIQILIDKDILQFFMYHSTRSSRLYSVCCGIYKKELIGNLRFRNGKAYEDMDFKYKLLNKSKRVGITKTQYYYYYVATGTTTTSGLKKRDFDLRESNNILCELSSKEDYGKIKQLGEVKKARTAFSLLCKILYFGISDPTLDKKNVIKSLTKEHRNNLLTLLFAPIGLSRKAVAISLAISFNMTALLVGLIKKSSLLTKVTTSQAK